RTAHSGCHPQSVHRVGLSADGGCGVATPGVGEVWPGADLCNSAHFVSDETDQKVNDNDGKFIEALEKYEIAVKRPDSGFGLTGAAKDYLSRAKSGNPPSLGTNKQLEIMHHLELVSGLLVGKF
ncbi:UNVERIFIED_CONTAM: hypothetical protein NO986_18025, partial [Comamonas sp. A-3]